jgi:D-amino-acid oxidase
VILGGSRIDNDWSDTVDDELSTQIKQRCCELCPELGEPEDLKVISVGVGLRRKWLILSLTYLQCLQLC